MNTKFMLLQPRLGFCSWSVRPRHPADLVQAAHDIGLGQVQLALDPFHEQPRVWETGWEALRVAEVKIASGMVGCVGEDYSSIAAIHRTGGVLPDETWPASWKNFQTVLPLAASAGITQITMHAGFIPPDSGDPIYAKILDRMTQVADLFATRGIVICLETGQEAAETLLAFLQRLKRPNVGINFDPANMLLYGSGDPLSALELLLPHVRSCHIKDAIRSPVKGEWGTEVPVGQGEVNWNGFFGILERQAFQGNLMIEREAGDQRIADIRTAVDKIAKVVAAA
ncbi:MAG: sugar phosphate isomerase/epimerase family protein [Pirellulales bacterium]|nr:sugar phosphate isomerase/epimerase family protein [Pirellulales bacterium]